MSDTGTSPSNRSTSPALVGVVTGLAVVLLLLTVGTLVVALVHTPKGEGMDKARTSALAAGRQMIINLDSLSATTIDADIKRVEKGITGKFQTLFTSSEKDLRDLYPKRKIASHGEVRASAFVKGDEDSMTLLVASDRTLTDIDHKDPVLQTSRWSLVMEKHGGRWLLADLEPVP